MGSASARRRIVPKPCDSSSHFTPWTGTKGHRPAVRFLSPGILGHPGELVYDTDRNQPNMLIGEDWKLWMIDFSRAFRAFHKLQDPRLLGMCDRQLLEKMRHLDEREVLEKTKPHLDKMLVKAVMARRDLIVAYYEKQIAEKGEDAVLY